MVGFRRGSTPTVTVEAEGVDLSGWDVYLTFKGPQTTVERAPGEASVSYDAEADVTVIETSLAQEETLSWPDKASVEVQLNAVSGDSRVESSIGCIKVMRTLKDVVI